MAYHTNRQNNNDFLAFAGNTSGGDPAMQLIRAIRCQRIYSANGNWYSYDHAHTPAEGQVPVLLGPTYDPDFTVRYMKIEGQDTTVVYDMPMERGDGSGRGAGLYCEDDFLAQVMHPIQITRLYLGARETACDAITLYA